MCHFVNCEIEMQTAQFRCYSAAVRSHQIAQAIDKHYIFRDASWFSGTEKDSSLFSGKKLLAGQSGKSKNLHQPFGLMSPSTTSQDRGGRNKVQAAQMRPLFGRS
jgi:hypothetical protein